MQAGNSAKKIKEKSTYMDKILRLSIIAINVINLINFHRKTQAIYAATNIIYAIFWEWDYF